MKNAKKPTREQKKILSKNKLNPASWLVVKNSINELEIVSRMQLERTDKKPRTRVILKS